MTTKMIRLYWLTNWKFWAIVVGVAALVGAGALINHIEKIKPLE